MDKDVLKRSRKLASEIKPQFNIGKSGITDTFIETVGQYLDAHEIVKIKASVAKDKDEVAKLAFELSQATDSEVIKKIGFTFVLVRE